MGSSLVLDSLDIRIAIRFRITIVNRRLFSHQSYPKNDIEKTKEARNDENVDAFV